MQLPSLPKRTLFLIFGYLAAFVIASLGSYFYFSAKKVFVKNTPPPVSYDYSPATPSAKTVNILLLGHGGEGHSGGSLMDSIILVSVNSEEKKAALISIPRDLYLSLPTDFDNTTNHKINEAYAIGIDKIMFPNKRPEFKGKDGGWSLMKYAAGVVTGFSPDYFIAVDFGGYQKAIDILGGVEVNVPKTYDDYFYPVKGKENETCGISPEKITDFHQKYSGFELEKQFACRYEHIHFDKGKVEMDGETALKYTRSRHGDGDFGRSERQFAVLQAIEGKVASQKIIETGSTLFEQLTDTIRTDIGVSQTKTLLDLLGNPEDYKIVSIHLSEENVLRSSKGAGGAYILVPLAGLNDFSQVKGFIGQSLSD